MVLQFLCPSCGHPIEIDDEWATQSVACPYCRNTVTAPAESNFVSPSSVPEARPFGVGTDGTVLQPPSDDSRGNRAAVIGFGLSCLWLMSHMITGAWFGPKFEELIGPDGDPRELRDYIYEHMQQGTLPDWIWTCVLMVVISLVLWVSGLICSIVGMKSPARRRLSIVAFGILALGPLFLCAGLFVGP